MWEGDSNCYNCKEYLHLLTFPEDSTVQAQESRQLTLTLILVCSVFLFLATPTYVLITVYSFVDNMATPRRFAIFQLLKTIFEQVYTPYIDLYWTYCNG